jgi:hypothetical protein
LKSRVVQIFFCLFLCSTIAHAQAYRFRGLRTGQTRGQVAQRLKELGYSPLTCKPSDQPSELKCSVSRTDNVAPERIELFFDRGIFDSLSFKYPSSSFNQLLDELSAENGPPTNPLHTEESLGFKFLSVDWQDRSSCPCEILKLTRTTDGTTQLQLNNGPLMIMGFR